MQDADGWFRLGETASRENYVYTGQFLTLSTTGDAVKSGVITDYDGDKRRAAARIPNTTPGQNSHFTISASANQDDGPRGFLVGDFGLVPTSDLMHERRGDPCDSGLIFRDQLVSNNQHQRKARKERANRTPKEDPKFALSPLELFETALKEVEPVTISLYNDEPAKLQAYTDIVKSRLDQVRLVCCDHDVESGYSSLWHSLSLTNIAGFRS
mmetsp:Transcript_59254/g.157546  ORF Transcript_59254/g.157546 Transcript_59254/m.157546 type:complete len:212 (+) Transcript_59254:6916-7551(+)